jgi:hypothetical protein
MVWEGVSGVKHIFLHIRRATCAACVSRMPRGCLTYMSYDVSRYVSRCSVSRRVCRDCMMHDVCLDEIDVYDLVEIDVCDLVEISRNS